MIRFTQYIRPNGRPVDVSIDRPEEIEALAHRMQETLGVRLETEVLTTGKVSLEAMLPQPYDQQPRSLASRICTNGPPVLDAVDRLIRDAYKRCLTLGLLAPLEDAENAPGDAKAA